MKTKSEQVEWIIEQFNCDPKLTCLDATDLCLLNKFYDRGGLPMSRNCWKSRIREASKNLGLTGHRLYNAESSPGAGIPLYSMCYEMML